MRRNDLTPRILAMILAAAISFTSVPVISYAQEETASIALENGALEETQAQPVETQPTETQPTETQLTEAQPSSDVPATETQPTQAETQNTETQPQETPAPTASESQPAETQPEEPQATETEPEVPQTTQIEESETQTDSESETEAEATTESESDTFIDITKKIGIAGAEAIISNAKEKVSDLLGKLASVIPGGEYLKSFFDLLTGVLGDEIIGNIGDDDSDLNLVIQKLEEIQTTLSSIAQDVEELKNTGFYTAINEIHRISGTYIGRLTSYNKAVKALKDAPATISEKDRIKLEGALLGARQSLETLAKDPDISVTLKSNLSTAIQYMCNDTVKGEGENPFLIYLNANKKNPNIRYGTELLEQQRKFDKTVWTFFVEGLSLYTACMEINASVTDNTKTSQDIAESLAELLTGSTNGSESYIGRSILNAIKIYNTEIRPKEDEVIGNYQPSVGDVSSFKVLTNVKTLNHGNQLETTDGTYNTEALMYLTNFQSNGYKSYLKKLNQMINDDYLAKYSKLKLRTFLTDKLGITVPAQSKYLILSEMYFLDGNYMKVIPLDEPNTSVQNLRFDNQEYDNLCFFSESVSQINDQAASVYFSEKAAPIHLSNNKGSTFHFDTFEEAWDFACSYRSSTTITLYKDVIAKKEGDEEFTRFGTGSNFTTKLDGKKVYGALSVKGNITINLNGYTINRNQDTAVSGGSVFLMNAESSLTLKNGTVTGGNTTGNGGAVYSSVGNVTLDHMTLTNNHADGYGGAMYYGNGGIDYDLIDTTITGNTAGKNGGGIYCLACRGISTADVAVKGVIIIRDNTVNGQPNNATLTDQPTKKTIFKLDSSFSNQSWIGVNTTSTDKWIDITDGSIRSLACDTSFHCDFPEQTKECYQGHFTRDWYICIYTNKK